MATLTVYVSALTLIQPVPVTPTITTGDTFANTGWEYVVIYNGNGSSCVVTLDITATYGSTNAAITDPTVTIPTLTFAVIGPFPPTAYGTTTKVTCSVVTSVTIYVIRATPL